MTVQQIMHEPQQVDADELSEWCSAVESHSLAMEIILLIKQNRLQPGSRLPTVRAFATSMGVRTSIVASAWARLREEGYIETRRRGGSVIQHQPKPLTAESGNLDLSHSSGDPELYPSLERALLSGLHAPGLHSTELDYMIPPLKKTMEQQWPFFAQDWTIVGASSESILLCVAAVCPPGSLVAVEQPTSSRLLRIFSLLGVQPIAVSWDQDGPEPHALESALHQGVAMFIYQPRSQLPLGRNVSDSRSKALAAILAGFPDVTVVEDDPLGALLQQPLYSIGRFLPERTLLVRSFCKTFGLDLRISVIGGSAARIAAIRQQRSYGLGMISRILQGALNFLLNDDATRAQLQNMRETYCHRRLLFEDMLKVRGIAFEQPQSGLLLWLPVENEVRVIAQLAASNILVSEGSRHFIASVESGSHISINIAALPANDEAIREIASIVADTLLSPQQSPFD